MFNLTRQANQRIKPMTQFQTGKTYATRSICDYNCIFSFNAAPKQATRLIKCECPECLAEGSPYIVRASQSTLDRGAPICPVHNVPMI